MITSNIQSHTMQKFSMCIYVSLVKLDVLTYVAILLIMVVIQRMAATKAITKTIGQVQLISDYGHGNN